MNILLKLLCKSNWDYIADFKDGYALGVLKDRCTVYIVNEDYDNVSASDSIICLQYIGKSVKKAISNNCKYLVATVGGEFVETYYTFLDTQLKEVEGHRYNKILDYVPGEYAIVVEMDGTISILDADLKKEKVIYKTNPKNRYALINQDYFYVSDGITVQIVNIKTKRIKEFVGTHVEMVADGEFYKIFDNYYDKDFNYMEHYRRIGKKDKHGRIPIVLKNGDIFIYHCN